MDIDGTLPENSDMQLQAGSGQIAPVTNPNDISGVKSLVRPKDIDSRKNFVSNVHFAATKEAITKHFSRCGEVLKAIILTDAATGQPKGSVYIEFSSRETTEIVLNLNETSFMSWMLLVLFIYMGFQSKFEAPF